MATYTILSCWNNNKYVTWNLELENVVQIALGNTGRY